MVHPIARVNGSAPLAGVHCARHTFILFPPPSPSIKSPIIPSLRHRHPTIASTVLQQPLGRQQGHHLTDMGNAHAGSILSFCGQMGRGAGADTLGEGGVRFSMYKKYGGMESRPTQQKMWGIGLFLAPRPCLVETTTVGSGHAAYFNLGRKHGMCG